MIDISRIILPLTLVLIVVTAVTGTLVAAPAEQRVEFQLGFKALADQIPQVVGQPIENEHWGDNGDSLQQTTTGLMAWRKADNWTAFTNGSRTWVNGPHGAQERANDERFEWEEALVAPAPDGSGEGNTLIAYAREDGNIWIVSLDGTGTVPLQQRGLTSDSRTPAGRQMGPRWRSMDSAGPRDRGL